MEQENNQNTLSKKLFSNWRFALSYLLGVNIIASIILRIVNFFIIGQFNITFTISVLNQLITLIVWIFGIWLGSWIIFSYLNKRYKIQNKKKALNLTIIYAVILYIVGTSFSIWTIYASGISIPVTILISESIVSLLSIAIFYFFSRKYIKTMDEVSDDLEIRAGMIENAEKVSKIKKRLVYIVILVGIIMIIGAGIDYLSSLEFKHSEESLNFFETEIEYTIPSENLDYSNDTITSENVNTYQVEETIERIEQYYLEVFNKKTEYIYTHGKYCEVLGRVWAWYTYTYLDKDKIKITADKLKCFRGEPQFPDLNGHVADSFMQSYEEDRKNERRFDRLNSINIAYDSENKNLAYVAKEGEKFCPIINGEKKKCYDWAVTEYGEATFSPDGKNHAYIVGETDVGASVVYNDQKGSPYDFIGGPGHFDVYRIYFSQDSKHFAYIAEKDGRYTVVIDNKKEGKFYNFIDPIKGLQFNSISNGLEIVYSARLDEGGEYVLVTDIINEL